MKYQLKYHPEPCLHSLTIVLISYYDDNEDFRNESFSDS